MLYALGKKSYKSLTIPTKKKHKIVNLYNYLPYNNNNKYCNNYPATTNIATIALLHAAIEISTPPTI